MRGFTKEQIARIKESVKAGSFCKEWWKQLSKTINALNMTDEEKNVVFTKVIIGLIEECYKNDNSNSFGAYLFDEINQKMKVLYPLVLFEE